MPGEQPESDAEKILELTMEGDKLSPEEARVLEKKLKSNPSDLESRALILGYYSRVRFKSPQAKKALRIVACRSCQTTKS